MTAEKKYRLYVLFQDRDPNAKVPAFPYQLSLLLSTKALTKTRSAVQFTLTNNATKLFPLEKDGYSAWRVDKLLVDPSECANTNAKILIAKLPATHALSYYDDIISGVIQKAPLLQRVPSYDCAIWAWQVLKNLKLLGAPFDTVPSICGSGSSTLEREMIRVADDGKKLKKESKLAHSLCERDFRNRADIKVKYFGWHQYW